MPETTEGQIISIDYEKEGKKPWKFTLETTDGEQVQVATYDDTFSHELVGAVVDVFLETNQYGYFTKSVDVLEYADGEPPEEEKPKTPAKKKAPAPKTKKTTTYKRPSLVQTSKPSERESFRKEAEEATRKNLETAIKLAEELEIDWRRDVQGLVALTDLAARTQTALFLDAKKDGRIKNFKRS